MCPEFQKYKPVPFNVPDRKIGRDILAGHSENETDHSDCRTESC